MKIRNGFVSNSSSSSFIINIGVITNKEQFLADTSDGMDCTIIEGVTEFNKRDFHLHYYDWAGYYYDNVLEEHFEKHPDDTLFIKIGDGGHDDSDFWNDGWMDYAVDLEDFYQIDQDFYNEKIRGMKILDQHFGAGRDG